jgi:hypothetical protein
LLHRLVLLGNSARLNTREINQKYQSEREKLISKFKSLENDFEQIIYAAKNTEHTLNGFRTMIYDNIKLQKYEAEKELA